MFGNNDNTQQNNVDPAMMDSVNQLAGPPQSPVTQQQSAADPAYLQPAATAPITLQQAHAEPVAGFSSMPQPAAVADPMVNPQLNMPTASPVAQSTSDDDYVATSDDSSTDDNSDTSSGSIIPDIDQDQLAGMKQHALEHLEPLVNHLDQSAEEEFRTTMMMIQSNDNHTLLEKALLAAKRIEDDTKRAEALLDIINEINYFATQGTQNN